MKALTARTKENIVDFVKSVLILIAISLILAFAIIASCHSAFVINKHKIPNYYVKIIPYSENMSVAEKTNSVRT